MHGPVREDGNVPLCHTIKLDVKTLRYPVQEPRWDNESRTATYVCVCVCVCECVCVCVYMYVRMLVWVCMHAPSPEYNLKQLFLEYTYQN